MRRCPQCDQACDTTHRFCPACGYPIGAVAQSDSDPLVGSTLPGGYVILELIGVGGMGRVYRAEQTALGRTVAVKIVHPSLLSDDSASARFITEARTASALNHPNSVSIIDFGKTDRGQLYLVMEYLRGRDLARVLYDEGPLPFRRIIDIVAQTLAALAEAHHLGIIHRDLKPENIVIEPMRTGGDFVKVVDFGLAKLLTESHRPGITAAGIVCGTPDYMAPEQGRGDPIDARSDLYGVGVILFQLLTGRLPFEGDTPTQVVLKHLTEPAPDPRVVAPERAIPAGLAMVCLSALAKRPTDRYQDADGFSAALGAVRSQLDFPQVRPSQIPEGPLVACPHCGSPIPRVQRFCGECGLRVSASSRPGKAPRVAGSVSPAPALMRKLPSLSDLPAPLVGRDEDLSWLVDRHDATSALHAARIVGGMGIGKTRLLEEFASFVQADGDVTVRVEPDPWGAEAGYWSARMMVQALSKLEAGANQADAPRPVKSGLDAIFHRGDLRSASPFECRRNAAEALRWALRRAIEASPTGRMVVLIDDLHRMDGASRNVFADLVGEPLDVPVLVVASHTAGFEAGWPGSYPARMLAGFSPELAQSLVGVSVLGLSFDSISDRGVPPMYVEQLIRFLHEGGTAPPTSLADLVATRIARMEASARRLLQAIAIVGDGAGPTHLAKMVEDGGDVTSGLARLRQLGMISTTTDRVDVVHPLLREIVQATTPAEVRRELHAQAAMLGMELSFPLEARALHALGAQDAFEALLLLDQTGDMALARDDLSGAVLAFRRGLELARKEIFRGELEDPVRAVIIFSRKLGDALTRAGDITDADGVLREALDLAEPTGEQRARLLFSLATVARVRQRPQDAMRYLRQAVDLAQRSGDKQLVRTFEQTMRGWGTSS